MQRKMEEKKKCQTCKMELERKRFNGRLEDYTVYAKRQYCSLSCANTKQKITIKTYHQRARKFRKSQCEMCESKSNLHVHHKDKNPKNNDLSNLQTLCASCHLKYHWQNGHRKPKAVYHCKVCGNPAKGRVSMMCGKHYQRFRKYGNPLMTKKGNANHGYSLIVEDFTGK